MTPPDTQFKALLTRFSALTKPLGFRKEGQNFRLFQDGGLCRIVNFQKSQWNHSERLQFFINLGVYFEIDQTAANRRFKEYDCPLRQRLNPDEHDLQKQWLILPDTDTDALFEDLRAAWERAQTWFQLFPTRAEAVEKILSGAAQPHCGTWVMHYGTAKLLTDMGYGDRVYEQIKDSNASMLVELARKIKE